MPIYEYTCDACKNTEEVFQKISDKPLELCSKCGGILHKIMSQNTFHLKGKGWYVTDYSKTPKKEDK